MISKELFVEAIELMKKKAEHEDALCKALELCSPQEYVNAFIYSEYEEFICRLLHVMMEIDAKDDTLEWWLWDCNFGESFTIGDIKLEDGTTPDLSSVEKLYDYLASSTKKDAQEKYLDKFYACQANIEKESTNN